MKRIIIPLLLFLILHPSSFAASTIDTNNPYAYGANVGWLNWYADAGTNGAVIGEFYCSGYIYSANVGWISLGASNGPANGYMYSNLSSNDWGVNNVGGGQLSGMAYGANIGWITFEQTYGQPRVDLLTGNLTGYAYSANCGWISLSNAFAFAQTDTVSPGQLDANGLPIAWELQYFGTTNINPNADPDGDGMSNAQEYQAGTNPFDPNDRLRITAISANSAGSTSIVTWTSHASRLYQVESRDSLVTGSWSTNLPPGLVSPDVGLTTTRSIPGAVSTQRFFRVQVIHPLSP